MIIENLLRNFTKDEVVLLGSSRLLQKSVQRDPSFPKVYYQFTEFNLYGRGDRYFESLRKYRFKSLLRRIESIIKKEKITYIIGVYPDIFYCLAACRAAKKSGISFSSYFHNTYFENTAIKSHDKYKIQKEIFESSEHIFVISDGLKDLYREKYQLEKLTTLVHTFFQYPNALQDFQTLGPNKNHYKLAAIGNFNASNMDATIRLANAIKNDPRYSLSLYTSVPNVLLKRRGLDPGLIINKGYIGPDTIVDALQKYDICVLTHGFSGSYGAIEYQTIFPTRTIDLLLSGKPILVHSPKGSFLNKFIIENNCAALVDVPDHREILRKLDFIISSRSYQKELCENARQAVSSFYGPRIAHCLRSKILIE